MDIGLIRIIEELQANNEALRAQAAQQVKRLEAIEADLLDLKARLNKPNKK